MTERPILFSGSMVRAILDGRKTQTRRVVRGALGAFWDHPAYTARVVDGVVRWSHDGEDVGAGSPMPRCPYGAPGDRLWVRETWAGRVDLDPDSDPAKRKHYAMYRSDEAGSPTDPDNWHDFGGKWRPSIYMPRWASRITLEVTAVRVERLQTITEDDARAEGVGRAPHCDHVRFSCEEVGCAGSGHRGGFAALWDSINAERARWASNPWAWVVEFKPVTP